MFSEGGVVPCYPFLPELGGKYYPELDPEIAETRADETAQVVPSKLDL